MINGPETRMAIMFNRVINEWRSGKLYARVNWLFFKLHADLFFPHPLFNILFCLGGEKRKKLAIICYDAGLTKNTVFSLIA